MKLYCIYDKVAKTFNPPFVAENDDVANRSFQHGLKGNQFASDFDLYCVGNANFGELGTACVIEGFTPVFVSHFTGEVIDNG